MARKTVNPTRMALTQLKRRLAVAKRGHKLLKDKQDAMVQEFMKMIRENEALRVRIESELAAIMNNYKTAQFNIDETGLVEALFVPTATLDLQKGTASIMNIAIPKIVLPELQPIELTYGFGFTPVALDQAVLRLANLRGDLVSLVTLEKACNILAVEIEKTRRRVNAIEYVMIPDMEEQIRYITAKLDDAERSNIIRLMKSKEIILAKEVALHE